jgi:LysR family transcriptional activator of nhaA
MQIQILGKSVWLNFHHLYYFNTISAEGSIARASEKLRLGQPTLSAQLKQFENSLGIPLFERSHKKLELTEAGKMVRDYAEEIFKTASEMVEVIHDKLPARRLHVQIGALDSVPKHLTLAVSKAALTYGNCMVSILEGSGDHLLRELTHHRIDVMISNFTPTSSGDLSIYSKIITKAPIVICGAKKYRNLKKDFPHSLSHAPFILPTPHSKLRHDLEHFFRLSGIHVDLIAETQDTATQKLMGIDGLGLIPMPLPAVSAYLKRKILYEIGQIPGVFEELFLISANRRIANPIATALMKNFKLE